MLRKLTLDEVQISYEVQPEELISVEGSFASDEPEKDREQVREIVDAVNRGHVEAWCTLVVKASWQHWSAIDVLGGCSFEPGLPTAELTKQVEDTIEGHGMKSEALASLQKLLETDSRLLAQLVV
jgi:hypothetical protein